MCGLEDPRCLVVALHAMENTYRPPIYPENLAQVLRPTMYAGALLRCTH